jgi:hypothetical protein
MYTDKTTIENYLLTTIDASFDTQITAWCSSVKTWIDNYTGRTFEATQAVKKYDGEGGRCLDVYDLVSVNSIWLVANNATGDAGSRQLTTADFYLYSDFENEPTRTPFNEIELARYGRYSYFTRGQQNIWIDGVWGYSTAVPDDIKMIATKLVASIIKSGKDGGIKSFSEGDYSVTRETFSNMLTSDLAVKDVLDWYKKPKALNGFKISRI